MKGTRVRELIAGLAAIILIVLLGAGVMIAMGKHVPFLSDFLGK